jgi:hypothetical protein
MFMGYSVVNGALEHLAKDLGIAENAVLQGMAYLRAQLTHTFLVSLL